MVKLRDVRLQLYYLTFPAAAILTGSDLEGAALLVHGEVLQVHDAGGHDGQPLGVEHPPVREQSEVGTFQFQLVL